MAEQLNGSPTRKVMAGALSGAVTVVAVWLLGLFAKVDIPPEVAVAVSTIISFFVSYFTDPAMSDQVQATSRR